MHNATAKIQTLTVRDEQVTVVPMTSADLTSDELADAIDVLPPLGIYGFTPLKGWHLYDANGEYLGRAVCNKALLQVAEYPSATEAEEADLYRLVNTSGTPHADADLSRAETAR